jgi:hypothetical protein
VAVEVEPLDRVAVAVQVATGHLLLESLLVEELLLSQSLQQLLEKHIRFWLVLVELVDQLTVQ